MAAAMSERSRARLVAAALAGVACLLAAHADATEAPPPCSPERAIATSRALRAWLATYEAGERAAYVAGDCARASVICVDRFGDHPFDTLPSRVDAGAALIVRAILPVADEGRVSVSASVRAQVAHGGAAGRRPARAAAAPAPEAAAVCTSTGAEAAAVVAAAAPIVALAASPGMGALAPPAALASDSVVAWEAWLAAHAGSDAAFTAVTASLEVPDAELGVDVDVVRTDCKDGGGCAPSAAAHHEIPIDNGRYYLELGVLVPVVYRGTRRATLAAGTTELRVGVEERWHVTGALMLDVFPLGRARGQVSSFRQCRERTCYANWLGVQVGTSFERPAEDWYLGLVIEPVSGLGIGLGAALTKGEYLAPGLAEGMLLPARAAFGTRTELMARPYLGLTLTTDVFHTVDRGALSLRRLR